MTHIAHLFQVVILLASFCSVGFTSFWIWPRIPFALHVCFAPLALILGLFCLEHYFPLGQLPFLWLPVLAWTAVLFYLRPALLQQLRDPVLVYLLIGFFVCYFWRYSYPDIWETSEQLPDLDHLMSWSDGTLLPANDHFAVGEPDTFYYTFQYYAGGLVHRFLGTTPGVTYHLAYAILIGVGVAAFGAGVQAATRSTFAGYVIAVWIVLGGNGTTQITPFMTKDRAPDPLDAMRFVGSYAYHAKDGMNDFGKNFTSYIGDSYSEAPMEYYSYIIWLGDYHPSLSSLVFLGLGILAIGLAEQAAPNSLADRACVAAGLSTTVIVIITNPWIIPLQGALLLVWLVYRFFKGRKDPFLLIAGTLFVSMTLIFPFFSHFGPDSTHYPMKAQWVPGVHDADSPERPPLLNWLAVMYPAFFIWLLVLVPAISDLPDFTIYFRDLFEDIGNWLAGVEGASIRIAPTAWTTDRGFSWLTLLLGASMPATYFFYIHDIYGGSEGIFNTTLKMWPWVYALVIVMGFISLWNFQYKGRTLSVLGNMIALLIILAPIGMIVSVILSPGASRIICAIMLVVLSISVAVLYSRRVKLPLWVFAAAILFMTVIGNSYILGSDWVYRIVYSEWGAPGSHPHFGELNGNGWFLENSSDACTTLLLQSLPPGVVLESKRPNSNDTGCSIGLFTGKTQVGAWIGHEGLWRGDRPDLQMIDKNSDLFYAGEMADPKSWLGAVVPGGVDYIVWLDRDNVTLTAWPKINEALKGEYDWHAVNEYNLGRWGLWVRKNPAKK